MPNFIEIDADTAADECVTDRRSYYRIYNISMKYASLVLTPDVCESSLMSLLSPATLLVNVASLALTTPLINFICIGELIIQVL